LAKSNLLVRGGADFSGLKKELEKVKNKLDSFQGNVSKTVKKIGAILGGLAIGKLVKDSTELAMGVESAVNQINRTMGSSAGSFAKWAETQAKSYGMAKSEAYKYGAVYSNLISGFAKDTAETTKYTEELLKASAVVASATGRTMEDTMERIRSGMLGSTEAIEDLGINVNVAMIESTNAFKQFANGKSWQQLDFQTQQQIRLMAILEQANQKYGDTLANTTATQMQMFRAELNNVKLSLGQAFMPILNTVLPLLTALASKLAYVMNIVAQFTQALFGKPAQAQAQATAISQQATAAGDLSDSLGSAAKEAKKAKGALAGFDEINNLSKSAGDSGSSGGDSGSSGGGSGAGGGVNIPGMDTSSFADSTVEVSKKVQEMANKVKKTLSNLANFFKQNKEIIISVISGLVAGFSAFQIITNWTNIIAAFKGAFVALSAAIGGISWPVVAVAAAIALVVANLVYLWQTNEGFRTSVIEAWNQIVEFITTVVTDMWSIIQEIWNTYGQTLINNIAGAMESIQAIILAVWEGFLQPVITQALEFLTNMWNNHIKGVIQVMGEFVMKLINGALEIWNNFIVPIGLWLIDTLAPVFRVVFGVILDVLAVAIASISNFVKNALNFFGGIVDFLVGIFTGNWNKAWNGIKTSFKAVGDFLIGVWNVVKGAFSTVASWFSSIFTRAWNGIKSAFSGVSSFFRGIWNTIKSMFTNIGTTIGNAIGGAFKNVVNSIIQFAENTINGFIRAINGAIGLINKIPGVNIKKISTLNIPKLAKGGIIDSPTLAMVGEAGKEAVMPLENNTGWITELAYKIADILKGSSSDSGSSAKDAAIEITLKLGDTTFARAVIDSVNKLQRQAGRTLIEI
jgi:phage-related protein